MTADVASTHDYASFRSVSVAAILDRLKPPVYIPSCLFNYLSRLVLPVPELQELLDRRWHMSDKMIVRVDEG